jgi:N-methylhydantoinase B
MTDLITAEIIREYLETVSEEMSKTMENTALSTVFSEAHDYSTGVFYFDGKQVNLLSRANSQPVHIYASVRSVEALLQFFKYNLNDGDLVLATDPYHGGSHIPDWTLMKPVFFQNKPVFFPAVRAHMMEVGGPVAGGYNSGAREVWHEGFRLSPMKIFEKGELRRDVLRMLAANNRMPDVMEGDLNAMIGTCRVGEERIVRLIERYGFATVLDAVKYILDYSERRVRAEIARWPDGEYHGRSVADQDFAGTHDVNVDVTIRVAGDRCTVDFAGTHPQTRGFINSVPGNTLSWVFTEFSVVMPDVPINSGFFRAVDVHLPEGSVVNPIPPAPVGNSTLCIGSDIGQAVMKALERIVPEKTGSAFIDLTVSVISGRDSRNDDQIFITGEYYTKPHSAGGAVGTDGWGGYSAPHASLKVPAVELMEVLYPVQYLQAEWVIDTAAPGKWRGNGAFWMRRRATTDDVTNHIYVQASRHPLLGFAGGGSGAGNWCVLDYQGADQRLVRDVVFAWVQKPGVVLMSQAGGGGGWGDPIERDAAWVLRDVLDEWVSIDAAQRDYGVVIDPATMQVNRAETAALRGAMRRSRRALAAGTEVSASGSGAARVAAAQ